MFRPRCLSVLLALAASFSASAQWRVSKVTFRNAGTRSQNALERAVGMHMGQKITRAQIQAAAQKLMDSGYFDDVKVDSKGAPGLMEVIFILYPESAAKETVAGFDNFVWFTPEELQAVVLEASPLFNGRIPDAGNLTDVMNAALQSAVAAECAACRVSNETLQPSTARPYLVTDFRVDPAPRIAAVHLTGVPAELAEAENAAIAKLTFTAYNEGASGDTTADTLLAPARDTGHMEARLENVQRTLNPSGEVEMNARLSAGPVYHVSAISLPANAPQAADKDVLHAGYVASRARLLATLSPIEVAYRRQGYMDAYIKPGETLDTNAHTVSYSPVVVPGEIYHLRSVTPKGLSAAAMMDFDKAWKMHPGDAYDADYVSHFIENNSALRSLSTYKATFKAEADPGTHLVDLTVKFEPSGIQAQP